jgi:hypothetical protein
MAGALSAGARRRRALGRRNRGRTRSRHQRAMREAQEGGRPRRRARAPRARAAGRRAGAPPLTPLPRARRPRRPVAGARIDHRGRRGGQSGAGAARAPLRAPPRSAGAGPPARGRQRRPRPRAIRTAPNSSMVSRVDRERALRAVGRPNRGGAKGRGRHPWRRAPCSRGPVRARARPGDETAPAVGDGAGRGGARGAVRGGRCARGAGGAGYPRPATARGPRPRGSRFELAGKCHRSSAELSLSLGRVRDWSRAAPGLAPRSPPAASATCPPAS